MSLFDIIKYQATDITSETELKGLPKELINLYWTEAFIAKFPSIDKCFHLAAGAAHHHEHYQKKIHENIKEI